jgi:non-ribosomal peptide synthetase-like protein
MSSMGPQILTANQRHQALEQFSHAELLPSLAAPSFLHTLFEAQARKTPQAIAVSDGSNEVTYQRIDAAAQDLAARLQRRGAGPGSLVALRLRRNSDVYVALLAILKTGAGYVPLDPEWPVERLQTILADCQAGIFLSVADLGAFDLLPTCQRLDLDASRDRVESGRATDLPLLPARPPTPDDTCYVIYTSGSTGKPKGVAVSHRSVCHLVRAEQHLFNITPQDRVFAGFSLAFDAAVEEIWLAFAAGATLVVGSKERMLDGLAAYLTEQRVSVFSTVPTLLATVHQPLPSLRLLIVGGEACPQPLVQRWATASCKMYNTYGPTEATVIATYGRLLPQCPVSIGRPIPNYYVYLTDDAGQPVAPGTPGEICIGGVGLAQHYINRPELTAQKFIVNPFAGEYDAPLRLYRTGDLGRHTAVGDIEFLGRLDEQVKLRGFRIELGEIEAALLGMPGVSQAAVIARAPQTADAAGDKKLIAYVVCHANCTVSAVQCRSHLKVSLPPYMVPAQFEFLDGLPILASGKVDKKALPTPQLQAHSGLLTAEDLPQNELEQRLAAAWCVLFGTAQVGRDQDFFRDLSGHSLLAAQMVSTLRQEADFASLSILDVYAHSTVAQLAEVFRLRQADKSAAHSGAPQQHRRAAQSGSSGPAEAPPAAAPRWAYGVCGALQFVALYGVVAIHSLQWLGPYFLFGSLREAGLSVTAALLTASTVLLLLAPCFFLAAVITKWCVMGRYRAGVYPLWGSMYFRFWLVGHVLEMAPTWLLVGTPLLAAYYRLLGARIGHHVHLAADSVECFDLVEIGDDAVVGVDASVAGYCIEAGFLIMGPIKIGARSVVGARSLLDPHSSLQADAVLQDLSRLGPHQQVPQKECWSGSPARLCGSVDAQAEVVRPSALKHALYTLSYAVASLLLPGLYIAALLPGIMVLGYFESHLGGRYWLGAPLVAASFVLTLCTEIVALKWLFLGRTKPGRYPAFSTTIFRLWLFERTMDLSLDMLGGLYATLFLNPWLRLLGVHIGKNAEISTASGMAPDLLHIGEEAFLADAVLVGAPHIARGTVDLQVTKVGRRSFIGNSATVVSGVHIGDDCLVGCLSAAPKVPSVSTVDGSSWFGSPPIAMPKRPINQLFSAQTTYKPTAKLVAQRLGFELLRILLPITGLVIFTCVLLNDGAALHAQLSDGQFVALFPLLYMGTAIAVCLGVIALKWLLMGRYRPAEKPLWDTFIWRNELVTALHENLADPLLNELLGGTPFAAWFFRGMGSKIGRRVYMGTTQFTEYDLIEIGDNVTLGNDCTLQTHLFEDRVMKMSTVKVGAHCSIGADAVILYDTEMLPYSQLSPLSLLMKGEVLPSGTAWEGIPAQRR